MRIPSYSLQVVAEPLTEPPCGTVCGTDLQKIVAHRANLRHGLRHGPPENCLSQSHPAARSAARTLRKLPLTEPPCGTVRGTDPQKIASHRASLRHGLRHGMRHGPRHGAEKKFPLTGKDLEMGLDRIWICDVSKTNPALRAGKTFEALLKAF